MEGLLRVISGPNVGACFVLEDRMRLGRATDADIQLDEPHISRQHARVRRQPDGSFELTDLGSTSGTTVNGAPIRNRLLQPHDVIAIGRSRFSFEVGTGTTTDACFSNKVRGFATLCPTQAVLAASVPAPAAKRKRRRVTQRRFPAMPEAERAERAEQAEHRNDEGAENLLDAILGPETDAVVVQSGAAANEDSGPEPVAFRAASPSVAAPGPSTVPALACRSVSRAIPIPIPMPGVSGEPRVEPASPPTPGRHSVGTPSVVSATESGSLPLDFDPQAREAALSTLRDVLDYRALRLGGLRGQSMDARASARYEQLSTRLLVDTHGLPSSRRFLRQPCPLPATLTQRGGALSRTLEVRVDDLSAGGVRLSMADPSVRVGDEVWIAFDLAVLFSFGQKVVFRSRVVWTSGRIGATGLMFGGNARFVDTVETAIATG